MKAQQYFVSLNSVFLDKKTLIKILVNPGLHLTIFQGTRSSPDKPFEGAYLFDIPHAQQKWSNLSIE